MNFIGCARHIRRVYIMKKLIYYLSIAIIACSICCCQSREEKALATIREEMNKTLDDINSYEPVETKIDSLKHDRYGDTLLVNVILRMKLTEGMIVDFEKDYKEAKKLFDIWDDPRMYNYSSFAYNKRKKAYDDMQMASIGLGVLEKTLQEYLDTLLIMEKEHTGELYGWRVSHKYRFTTKDGTSSLNNLVFFMDKKCEKILFKMSGNEEDDFSWQKYVNYLDHFYSEANSGAKK